ncbi:MAG TPA: chemotaxis protein CheW [Gemmatimonadaceae bacterium]|jgi:purine-binding chemotaxis protein CheW|nr:chemotaxis protein CheW [Gemmatimonadaceae bacterium]
MNTDATKFVNFRLGDDLFAADIFAVERVLRYQTPRMLPDVPSWIEGMIEYQQRVIPVVNLRRRFELPDREVASDTRIIVLNARGDWIGVVVDSVVEVSTVEAGNLSAAPTFFRGLAGEYLKGIVRRGEGQRLVIVLDVEQLLSSTEHIALQLGSARGTPIATTAVIDA